MPTCKWTHRKFADIGGPGDCDAPEPDDDNDDDTETDNDARGVFIEDLRAEMTEAYEACTRMARQKDDLHRAVELANARADRQAARAERAEADLARQKRVTALMAQVAREMTRGAE